MACCKPFGVDREQSLVSICWGLPRVPSCAREHSKGVLGTWYSGALVEVHLYIFTEKRSLWELFLCELRSHHQFGRINTVGFLWMPICIFSQKRGPCESSFYAMLQWHFYLCFLISLTNWQQGHGGISQRTFSKPLWQIDMRDICCFHREMCFQDVGIHAELMIYHLQRLVGLNFASDVFWAAKE